MSLLGSASFAGQPAEPQQTSSQDAAAERKAVATCSNMLAVDGCSYPVTIGGTDYAPDAASRETLAQLIPAGSTIRAQVNYSLTGGTATVECGFGVTRVLPEITVEVIRILQ